MSASESPSVLLIGNFLSGHVGNFSVCEDLAEKLRGAGLRVTTASSRKPRLQRLFDIVSTVIRRRRDYAVANVDVYSGFAFGLAESACLSLRLLGKPYVLTLRGGNLPSYAEKWPWRIKRLFEGASVITTPSDYLAEHLKPYCDDIQLLPNPLHLSRYTFRLRESVEPKLVWIRSFHRIYNPMMAPQVVAQLKEHYPDVSLTMVGPDKGDGSLQETQHIAGQLGVDDRITFTGGVPKESVPQYLAGADVLINTTNLDNTPTTVLEAMATGLCVVSTNVGGMSHLVADGSNALLVPPQDPDAMTNAICRLFSDAELSATLSQNARDFASQFDWNEILPQWVQLLFRTTGADCDGRERISN